VKYGARNQIEGVVTGIKKGDIMAQVSISIPQPTRMGSVMTVDSLDELNLKVGDKVKVVVKAISVLVVKE
jgi:molybdopterin-binding protein